MELSAKRLNTYESRYDVTSDYFLSKMSAEDLEGGDDEYISWAGEYRLRQKLGARLHKLKSIEYDN